MQELQNTQILEAYRKEFQIGYTGYPKEIKELAYQEYAEMLNRVSVMDEQTRDAFLQAELAYFTEKRDKIKQEVERRTEMLLNAPEDVQNRTVFLEVVDTSKSSHPEGKPERETRIYSHLQLATRCASESYDYSREIQLLQSHLKRVSHRV